MQLSRIWSDGMIIQRQKEIVLKGYARGNKVTITFADKVFETLVGDNQYFEIQIPPMEAGGPYEMVLYDGERSVISDILIGDVWILGGQSNMELPIVRTLDKSEVDVKNASNSNIRMFQVPKECRFDGPRAMVEEGSWSQVDAKSVMNFSAIGYFLADYLYKMNRVPVGLIHTAIGGTPVEAWMSEETLQEMGLCEEVLSKNKDYKWVQSIIDVDNLRIAKWHEVLDLHDLGVCEKWYTHSIGDTQNIMIPGMWENTSLNEYKGSVWFQKEFEVSQEWLNQEVMLRLGAIIDGDETYVNGILVGHTDYRFPPRKYLLPPNLLQKGKNQVTVRVFSDAQPGGFMPGKQYGLQLDNNFISLEGEWKYRVGTPMERLEPPTFFQYEPAGVFNGVISPLKDVGISGVAFYQGESNTNDPSGYAEKLERMIQDWRRVFGQGEIPFLYVQLANFTNGYSENPNKNWEALRIEQEKVLRVSNTAMVDAFDVGEYNDLHPQNKKEVARRLFLAAKKLVYGEEILVEDNLRF